MDLSSLLFAELKGNQKADGPVKYFGIDMNPICVARAYLLSEMLLLEQVHRSIFEVWYCSSLCDETKQDMQDAIQSLLERQ